MNKQYFFEWSELIKSLEPSTTVFWVSNSIIHLLEKDIQKFNLITSDETPSHETSTLVVIGGGSLIDKAKIWKLENKLSTKIIAIPSIWGSGSEGNNIAVTIKDGVKLAYVSDELIPFARSIHPELHNNIPQDLAMWGRGDVFSHAIEAFLSPLANDNTREEISNFIKNELLLHESENDISWFELSRKASFFQAQTSVGLVHAIAHELEPKCKNLSHAKICSIFLLPVISYNLEKSEKVKNLFKQYSIDLDKVFVVLNSFFVVEEYNILLPSLQENWKLIIRNPLSRINSATVTLKSIEWFLEKKDFSCK